MGTDISQTSFAAEEFEAFGLRLEQNLQALRQVLARPDFGQGEITLGAELELTLTQPDGRPALVNQRLLEELADSRFTTEINRYNIEFNADPMPLAGAAFSRLAAQLRAGLETADDWCRSNEVRLLMIGILPSLGERDMGLDVMTPLARYRTLDEALCRLRGKPFHLDIHGEDHLDVHAEAISYEGANTSFQLHMRVPHERFAATFNAAQVASGLVIAASGNSPYYLGRRLWEETRVIAFKQAVDPRDESTATMSRPPRAGFGHRWINDVFDRYEEYVYLFPPILPVCDDEDTLAVTESGGMPELAELRLHAGTVWHWNRPVYDPHDRGHLRIEFRVLPAGPSVDDMVANAAALMGLTLLLSERDPAIARELPIDLARTSFYEAARIGLGAGFWWPQGDGRIERRPVRELLLELLPQLEPVLVRAGIEADDCHAPLELFRRRVESGQTASVWQHDFVSRVEAHSSRDEAFARMLAEYDRNARDNTPVHAWERTR